MNPDVKRMWIEALRSDRFTQGRGRLKRRYIGGENKGRCEHCVLGVLCELFAEKLENPFCQVEEKNEEFEVYLSPHTTEFDDTNIATLIPSCMITEWAGLGNDVPKIKVNGQWHNIWSLNDNGYTFAQLADLIEAQL